MIISATLHTLFSADAEGHFGFYYFMINHKITEKEKRDNLGRRGIYFWRECNFVAEYVIEKEGEPPLFESVPKRKLTIGKGPSRPLSYCDVYSGLRRTHSR